MNTDEMFNCKEKKDKSLYIRMTKTEMDALELASYETDDSKSDIVRKALKTYLGVIGLKFE